MLQNEKMSDNDHYDAIYQNSDRGRRAAGETPEMAHARYDLADVKDWITLEDWREEYPKYTLARKNDGAKVVKFENHSEKSICITFDNGQQRYPAYELLMRFYDLVLA